MKICMLLITTLLLPAVGWATHSDAKDDSDTPSDHASCNASFQQDCPEDTTIASDTVAAPIGNIGTGTIESLVLIILLGGIVRVRIAKKQQEARLRTGAGYQ